MLQAAAGMDPDNAGAQGETGCSAQHLKSCRGHEGGGVEIPQGAEEIFFQERPEAGDAVRGAVTSLDQPLSG